MPCLSLLHVSQQVIVGRGKLQVPNPTLPMRSSKRYMVWPGHDKGRRLLNTSHQLRVLASVVDRGVRNPML